jgi:type II secretory pathway component GspD/PulD (secretin)
MEYVRNAVDSISLAGLSTNDMTEIGNIARNVFQVRQINVDAEAAALTLRGSVDTLNAFNATYHGLLEGRSQVLLDVRILQLAHNGTRNTGVQPMQTVSAFNLYAEEQSILTQNAALVQQIISSGLAAPGDTLTILGILIASGQVQSSLFQNGLVVFGGGITQSALVPGGPFTVNLNLNSSDSRALDDYRIRLEDGEEGTLKSGSRYPIITGSYGGGGGVNIPGLSLPGTSGSLGSLLSSLQGASATIPQFQYQDLGLTLKARPRVLRSGDVAMNLDLKITALAGSSLNDVPVLANRAYEGAVTVPQDQGVVLAAEIDKSEMRAISGWPGLSEIPGFSNITDKDIEKNTATLLIIITPHVVRSPHLAGHSPMYHVDKTPGFR